MKKENRECDQKNKKKKKKKKKKNKGCLDEETVSYYRRIESNIEGDVDEEEGELLLNGVFTQMKDDGIPVAQNQKVSKIVEKLITHARPKHWLVLWQLFATDWHRVCTDRFASHVLEKLIWLLGFGKKCTELGEDDIDGQLKDLFLELCDFLEKNLQKFVADTFVSHIIRVTLEALSGVTVPKKLVQSKMKHTQSEIEPKSDPVPPSKEFLKKLYSITSKIIFSLNISELEVNSVASPLLQTLLFVYSKVDRKTCHDYCYQLAEAGGLLANQKDDKKTASHSRCSSIILDKIGAYLVEQLIAVCSDKLYKKLFDNVFLGRTYELAIHPKGRFVLQMLIRKCQEEEQMETLFKEILPHLEELIRMKNMYAVINLAETCVTMETQQTTFIKHLLKALHCDSPADRQILLVPLALGLKTYEDYVGTDFAQSKELNSASGSNVTMLGSRLVQNLLRFSQCADDVAKSFLSYPPVELQMLACSLYGGYVMDAFIQSRVVLKKRKKALVDKLKGHLITIACDKIGSRVLEGLWKNCSDVQQTAVAQKLMKKEIKLKENKYGSFIYSNLHLDLYKTDMVQWQSANSAAGKKRKMFEYILQKTGNPTSKKAKIEK